MHDKCLYACISPQIRFYQRQSEAFKRLETMDPDTLEAVNDGRQAVVEQWLSARTPLEIAAAKQMKVAPAYPTTTTADSALPLASEFDAERFQRRKRWGHWEQADTLHILGWAVNAWLDDVLLKRWKQSLLKSIREFYGPKLAALRACGNNRPCA